MNTVIFGASDDLIEVRSGALTEEFSASSESNYIALSNGVLVRVHYDHDGMWRVRSLERPDAIECVLVQARGEGAGNDQDGCPGYSDKLIVEGPIQWVSHGTAVSR